MKEIEAKQLVIKHLINKKKHDVAIPEISIGNNNVRSDIFALNGDITIYEIKTKSDTLTRLENQLKYYQQFANKVYVVVDKKFLDKLNINENVGIYELKSNNIKLIREATSQNISIANYLSYWWTIEYKEILRGIKGFSKITNYEDGQKALKNILSDDEIKQLTLYRLKERYKEESDEIKYALNNEHELDKIFKKRKMSKILKITPLLEIPFGQLKSISLQ